jgi:hypothetical protein
VIKIETTTEIIESKGGLLLAGEVAGKIGLMDIKSALMKKAGTVITSIFGLMVEGNSDFESIGEKRGSLFFREALRLGFVYAKETIRLYLEQMAVDAEGIIEQLRESTAKILKMSKLHGIWIGGKEFIPVDIDTSVMDNSKTKKEGVSRTYRKVDGFQPIMAYVGKEGYMLDCELRPGSQHCQNGTVEFITKVIGQLCKIKVGKRFLFRLDSGNDAWENMKTIISAGLGYFCIIKRNKRRECDERWLKRAKRHGKLTVPRKGKKIWVGSIKIHPRKNGESIKDVYCVFEVTERKSDSTGNPLLIPEIEVSSWWTNLRCGAEKVIELYRDHATSEQFHSELKHDMGIERLPSGKFAVNKILLAVAMNAYNTLRFLGQHAVVRESRNVHKRKRLGKVIRDVICVAGKLVRHARSLVFKIYERDPMLPVFFRVVHALNST